MKPKHLLLLTTIIAVLSLIACQTPCVEGSGPIKVKNYDYKDFSEITLKGQYDIEVNSCKNYNVQVSAEENIIDLIQITQKDNQLIIQTKPNKCIKNSKAKITITLPKIEKITVIGSGDIYLKGNFTPVEKLEIDILGSGGVMAEGTIAKNIYATIKGSGDIKLKLDTVNTVAVKIIGSGDALISGIANKLEAEITGSGDVKAKDLIASIVIGKISGSGDMEVWATKEIDIQQLGSGDVIYYGNPEKITIKNSGTGSIQKQ